MVRGLGPYRLTIEARLINAEDQLSSVCSRVRSEEVHLFDLRGLVLVRSEPTVLMRWQPLTKDQRAGSMFVDG